METMIGLRHEFTLPSGLKVTIREQNGGDDDVLSNAHDALNLMNFSKFISRILVTPSLSPEEVHDMPVLDKYVILVNSRILSLGETLNFSHTWNRPDGSKDTFEYEQDLHEYLLDYGAGKFEAQLENKPMAIPPYDVYAQKDIEFTLKTGKVIKLDLLTSRGEAYLINLPSESISKNSSLIARNLQILIDDKWEPVKRFDIFSVREMAEIRTIVKSIDPTYTGVHNMMVEVTDPKTNQCDNIPLMALGDFFYLGE